MKLIIKNDKVLAYHEDSQNVTGFYPDTEVLNVPDSIELPMVEDIDDEGNNIQVKKSLRGMTKQEVLDLLSDDEKKQVQLNASKETRNMELEANVVEFGEYTVWAAPAAFSNLQMLHDSMGDEDTEEIYQDLEIIPVTKADLAMILAVGTAQGKLIHDAHKERVRSL